jgi:hypothetical protein
MVYTSVCYIHNRITKLYMYYIQYIYTLKIHPKNTWHFWGTRLVAELMDRGTAWSRQRHITHHGGRSLDVGDAEDPTRRPQSSQ